MDETLKQLKEISNSHSFQKVPEFNENGDFKYDVVIAIEIIRDVMSKLKIKHENCTGLLIDISNILHATDRIDKMVTSPKDFNKIDLTIYHYYIKNKINTISDPKYWRR